MSSFSTQPMEKKVFQGLCGVLAVLGLLKFIGFSVLGFLFGLCIIGLAVCGLFGSFMNHKKALFFFLCGIAILFVPEIIYFFVNESTYTDGGKDSEHSTALYNMVLGVFMIFYYAACLYFGWIAWKS